MLNKAYLLAKKFHRWLVVVIVILGMIMSTTGFFLKFPDVGNFLNVDLLFVRSLHSLVSIYFSGTFFLMATTGLIMFLFPYLKKRSQIQPKD